MSFFKAYDMRGTFGTDFDLDTVYRIGRVLPKVVKGRRWLIGRDCRVTSKDVRDALVRGLAQSGVEVTDLGLCTTPMVYFFTAEENFDGSVMITASHNPPSDNGLKVSMRTALPVGYANGLNEVESMIGALETFEPSAEPVTRRIEDALPRYLAWQREHTADAPFDGLRVGVDCSNGMSSLLVKELFPGAVIINDTPDGRFPNHSPNPLKDEAREQIAQLVRERKLDCGVIFDGDADRAMLIDERGEFVQPDYLIPVVARATRTFLADTPGSSNVVVHDVRTSRGVIEALSRMGFRPMMVPVGHAFAKPVLRETKAICGGELAGHYYFGEFHGCDSGLLAALRILGEIARAKCVGMTFSQMMHPISGVYANSGEINFRVEDKGAAIARVLSAAAERLPHELSRSEIDGIRIEYAEGWVNIRQSNTEPYLRLIVECDTAKRLQDWLGVLKAAVED